MKRPLLTACIGLVLGEAIAVLEEKSSRTGYVLLFLVLSLFLMAFCFEKDFKGKSIKNSGGKAKKVIEKKRKIALLIIIFFLMGGFFRYEFEDKKILTMEKTDMNLPVECIGTVEKIDRYEDYTNCILYKAVIYGEDGKPLVKNLRVLLRLEGDTNVKIGNKLRVNALNKGFDSARNPGNFDAKSYYKSLKIAANLKVKDYSVADKSVNVFKQTISDLKHKIQGLIDKVCGSKAALIKAIVTGDKSSLDDETKTTYQIAGISHILAVSGLHISIIGMAVYKLFRRRFAFFPSIVSASFLMISFCILCDSSVSVMRAVIMFIIRLIAELFGRRYDITSSLSLAAIIVLISNPFYISNGSFQMSFLAITAIITLNRALSMALEIKGRIAQAFISSLSITIFTAPIVINMFNELSIFGIFLNIMVIPLMTFVLASGLMSVIAAFLSIFIAKLFAGAAIYILSFYDLLCKILEIMPFCVISPGHLSGFKILLYYFLIAALILICYLRSGLLKTSEKEKEPSSLQNIFLIKKRFLIMMFMILLLMTFVCFCRTKGSLQIVFADVGQGDSIFIKTPENKSILIDGGSSDIKDVYEKRLEGLIKYFGKNTIDYCFLSHGDYDHISGVLEMLQSPYADRIRIKTLILSEAAKDNDAYDELKIASKKVGTEILYVSKGTKINIGSIEIKCLYPIKGKLSDDENENSQVLAFKYKDLDILFTGDLGKEGEEVLLKEKLIDKEYEVLKVGHHGSKNSSSEDFLKAVSPEVAVISAGVNNRYGHPHGETLGRLDACNAKIYITNKSAAIILKSDGVRYNIETFIK